MGRFCEESCVDCGGMEGRGGVRAVEGSAYPAFYISVQSRE